MSNERTTGKAASTQGVGHAEGDAAADGQPCTKPNRHARRAAARSQIDLSADGFLRLEQVLALYPVSRATWYAGMSQGLYPKPVALSRRSKGWSRADIRNLIANPPVFSDAS